VPDRSEGDYGTFPDTIAVGDEKHAPSLEQILQALRKPQVQVVANLMGIALADRPAFCASLLPHLQEMRLRTGRPHWLIIDEAHHLLPPGWVSAEPVAALNNVVLITVHPDHLDPAALKAIDVVFAVGPSPEKVLAVFESMNHRSLRPAKPLRGFANPAKRGA